MAYSDLDDVDYLVEDNVMDEFCLSPEMEETHGRMAHWWCKLGTKCKCWNDSGNWGRTQQQRVNSMFEKIIALPRKLRVTQLVPMITPSACACSQELEHFHIQQGFTNIRVKDPVTQLTTMMAKDG